MYPPQKPEVQTPNGTLTKGLAGTLGNKFTTPKPNRKPTDLSITLRVVSLSRANQAANAAPDCKPSWMGMGTCVCAALSGALKGMRE